MDSKAQLIVDVIAKLAQGKIKINNAANLLNKSRITIERYLQKYNKERSVEHLLGKGVKTE